MINPFQLNPIQKLILQFRAAYFLSAVGWLILFLTNWKVALGCFCVAVGAKMENNLRESSLLNIIESILSSLKSLIKKDDITEESEKIKKIKNN